MRTPDPLGVARTPRAGGESKCKVICSLACGPVCMAGKALASAIRTRRAGYARAIRHGGHGRTPGVGPGVQGLTAYWAAPAGSRNGVMYLNGPQCVYGWL